MCVKAENLLIYFKQRVAEQGKVEVFPRVDVKSSPSQQLQCSDTLPQFQSFCYGLMGVSYSLFLKILSICFEKLQHHCTFQVLNYFCNICSSLLTFLSTLLFSYYFCQPLFLQPYHTSLPTSLTNIPYVYFIKRQHCFL